MAQVPPGVLGPFRGQRQLAPGTRVQIGAHLVTVQRFLSQGGFAHVYLVQADQPVSLPDGTRTASLVLKHMCVWTQDTLRSVRAEVEYHRKLQGHAPIVHFVEASAAHLQGDGWEIFLLMEYASGGALIDFLNTRLQHRLQEHEVLTIFRDVCRGVQVVHAKGLVHRDLKIENVLLTQTAPPQYKLCDFGSCFAAQDAHPARTLEEQQRLEAELNMHTTLWYRAPEMVDLRAAHTIDQRADVWALGVLLYKLCYYTTPFEGPHGGPAAILAARYETPSHPAYSPALQALIASLLQADPARRPSIDDVLAHVEHMRSTPPHKAHAAPTQRASPAAQREEPHRAPPTPLHESETFASVDEASARFPSIEALRARPSVRSMAARFPTHHPRDPATKPTEASAPKTNAAADHIALEVLSSDDEEGPEEAEPSSLFRIRARSQHPAHTAPASPPKAPAMHPNASRTLNDGPAHALSTLLAHESVQHTGDTSLPAEPPEHDELASLAAHEKALEALLGTPPPSEAPPPPTEAPTPPQQPAVGDLLGIEGLSVSERVSQWGKQPPHHTSTPGAQEASSPRKAPARDDPATFRPPPHPAASPPRASASAPPASASPPPASRPALLAESFAPKPSTASSPPPETQQLANKPVLPPSIRAKPASSQPIKIAPSRVPDTQRPISPPTPKLPQRSATWDAAGKPPVWQPDPVPPPPKAYVDASTSPDLKAHAELPIGTQTTDEGGGKAPSIRARMAQLQQQADASAHGVRIAKPAVRPKPEARWGSAVPRSRPALAAPPDAPRDAPSVAGPETAPERAAASAVSEASPTSATSPPEPARHATSSPLASVLSQPSGQVRLTKRPTQSAPRETPWAQEAAAAQQCQGRLVAAHFDRPASTEPAQDEEEAFVGVHALIDRWQARR